jgi:cardiolipin synthase (CMP-forming)
MIKKLFCNIPNILSAWRLLTFPVLLWFIFSADRQAFIILISINLVTDILDGLIARVFRLQTEFGARLDSLADITTYLSAFIAMVHLEWDFVSSKEWEFIVLIALWLAGYLVCLIRFRKTPHLHLYSTKTAGYLQGIFIFTYFNWGNADWYFYLMWSVSILAFLEELIIVSFIPALRSNAKGIFRMLMEKGRIV